MYSYISWLLKQTKNATTSTTSERWLSPYTGIRIPGAFSDYRRPGNARREPLYIYIYIYICIYRERENV